MRRIQRSAHAIIFPSFFYFSLLLVGAIHQPHRDNDEDVDVLRHVILPARSVWDSVSRLLSRKLSQRYSPFFALK